MHAGTKRVRTAQPSTVRTGSCHVHMGWQETMVLAKQ